MDTLIEIIISAVLEASVDVVAESRRIPVWVKVSLAGLFWLAVEAALVWAVWAMLLDGEAWPVLIFTGGGCLIWSWLGVRLTIELFKRGIK